MDIKQALTNSVEWLKANPRQHGVASLAENTKAKRENISPFDPNADCFCVLGRAAIEMDLRPEEDEDISIYLNRVYTSIDAELINSSDRTTQDFWKANDLTGYGIKVWNHKLSIEKLEEQLKHL